jgi:hypothetical protein
MIFVNFGKKYLFVVSFFVFCHDSFVFTFVIRFVSLSFSFFLVQWKKRLVEKIGMMYGDLSSSIIFEILKQVLYGRR